MENKFKEKINYLASLGFTNIEVIEVYGYDTEYHFEDDGMNRSIFDCEFDIKDTAPAILSVTTFYSCCGDILDKDYMICPTCKEHC